MDDLLSRSMPKAPYAIIYLQARSAGAGGNYSLAAGVTYDTTDFTQASFTASPSGAAMSGGTNGASPTTVYDSGTVTITVGSFTASAPYSQSGNSTAALVASALVSSSNPNNLNRSGSPVTASASGSTLTINYATVGTAGNITLSCSSATGQTAYFSGPSFTCPSTTALSGGYNAEGPSLDFNYFVTQYSYDALGNLLNVTQKGDPAVSSSSQWRLRNFTYDSLSRLLTATNPESGAISYSYDADGNVLQKTSPAPNQTGSATQTISYCYDPLNRITGKVYSAQSCPLSSPVVTYSYDAGTNGIGHLTSLTDQAGAGSYSYDGLGRIASENRTIAGIQKGLAYTYNLDNSVATLTYPSGAIVTYTPDSAGRMLSAVDNGNNISYVTSATYGPDNGLTGLVSGQSSSFAGITNSFTYNKRLQPVNMSAASLTATVFSIGYDFRFGNGDNGNVFGITNYRDASRNQSFTYDALNRLTSAQNAGTDCTRTMVNGKTEYWGNSYGYDAWGNLLQKTPTKCSAENLNVAVAVSNQIHTISGPDYLYDAAGNMTHDATSGLNYSFDQENRINGAAGYTYTYDADGNRVEKSNGSTGTIYWYMSPGIVAESDLTGALKSEYVFFDGDRVARKDFPGNAVSYYFSDHLATASVMTNSTGTITEDEDFYPWGGELQFVNNDSNHYKYGGHERDNESSLDYYGARYYANWTGRFLTADWAAHPITVPYASFGNPQSLNLYSYVRNNPTTLGDPDGHQCSGPPCVFYAQHVLADPNFGKNVAIGAAKGLGKFAVDTGKVTLAILHSGTGRLSSARAVLNTPTPQVLEPSNLTQAAASKITQTTLSVGSAAVGAAGFVTELAAGSAVGTAAGLSDSALVVRGGVPTAAQLTKGAESIAADGTLNGVSVQSANGASVEQLSRGIPNNQIGVTTVGDVRAAGGDVVPTPQPGNPCHCDMNGVTSEQGSQLFKVQPNPSKVKAPKSSGGDD